MKVSFKLTPEQTERAQQRVALAESETIEEGSVWVGNVGGWMWDHTSLNPNQKLSLEEGNLLTYQGVSVVPFCKMVSTRS